MKKAWFVVAAGVLLVLGEGIYAQWRALAGLDGASDYLKLHSANEIWAAVAVSVMLLLASGVAVWGTRAIWRWRIRSASAPVQVALQTLRLASGGLAIAGIISALFMAAVAQVHPTYAELGLGERGHDRIETVLYTQAILLPGPVVKFQIERAAIRYVEYTFGQEGLALVKEDGSREMVFHDFDPLDLEAAESLARKLGMGLEQVESVD